MTENTNLPSMLLENCPWEKGSNPIWLSSTFILRRNLNNYHFPHKLDGKQLQQTYHLLQMSLLKHFPHAVALQASEMTPLDKEFFFEYFLCMEGFQHTLSGQGFVIDHSADVLALLNVYDHLQLHLIDRVGNWEKTWNTLNEIENQLSTSLHFAFNSKFGYLSSHPSLSGTALTVYAHLHLPALIHTKQLEDTLLKHKEEEVTTFGMEGTMQEVTGDLLVLHNTYTLGVTEASILHSLHSTAMKLMAFEKTLRTALKNKEDPFIKDLISRSYGLLLHSYQIQTKEALNALSMMKLGLSLGWIGGITDQKINAAFFLVRKAHLLHTLKAPVLDADAIAHQRAEFIHKYMLGMTLVI